MRKTILCLVFFFSAMVLPIYVYAHPGRTDSRGGHYNRSTGEYHYHHGYSEHQHRDMDGDGYLDCPYEFDDKTTHNSTPQYTIDPKLKKDMEDWQKFSQEYTYPEEYSRIKESSDKTEKFEVENTEKPKMLQAAESKRTSKEDDIPIVFVIPAFYVILLLISTLAELVNDKFATSMYIFVLCFILFTLPICILFALYA